MWQEAVQIPLLHQQAVSGTFIYSLVSIAYQAAPICSTVLAGSATITVTPTVGTPTVPAPAATTICQGSVPTAYTTSATDATSYNWTVTGAGNSISGAGTTGTVTWGAAFTGVATISVTANGCNGPSAPSSTTVTVNPTPTASISGTTTVCQGGAAPVITFTNPMTLAVTVTYNINAGGNTTINVPASSTNTVVAPTGVAGTFNYNLVNVFYQVAPACSNNIAGTATVTVRPTPTATISGTASVCQGGASPDITFTNALALPITVTYNINGGAPATINVGAASSNTVAAPTGVPGAFVYNLVSVDYQTAPTCTNAVAGSATVTVRPTPTATISGSTTVCFGAVAPVITFTNPQAFPVTVTYNINGAPNTTINVPASSTNTLNAPTGVAGTFNYNLVNVFYQAAPACLNAVAGIATVIVTPTVGTPTTPAPAATTICQGSAPTSYTTLASDATTYNWSVTGAGNSIAGTGTTGTVTWAAGYSGTATVSVTANGCSGPSASASTTVVVRPTPTATVSGTVDVCQGAASPNVTFTNPMALGVTITYNINGGANNFINVGASSSLNVAAPTGAAGTFNYNIVSVVYQTVPTCSNAPGGTATVTVRPTPTATISGTITVCQNGAAPDITFTNPQTLPVTVRYNINGGANIPINVPASSTNTVAAPTAASGSFIYTLVDVVYQAAPTCTNALAGSATVTVRPTPTASISGTTTVCQNAAAPNVTFTNPMALPVTVTYNINGGGNTTVSIGALTNATVAAPTATAGPFVYNLVSVDYQTAPTCTNAIAGSATITVTATVGTPTVPAPAATTICQGSAPTAYTTSATDATTYNWSVTGAGNSYCRNGYNRYCYLGCRFFGNCDRKRHSQRMQRAFSSGIHYRNCPSDTDSNYKRNYNSLPAGSFAQCDIHQSYGLAGHDYIQY